MWCDFVTRHLYKLVFNPTRQQDTSNANFQTSPGWKWTKSSHELRKFFPPFQSRQGFFQVLEWVPLVRDHEAKRNNTQTQTFLGMFAWKSLALMISARLLHLFIVSDRIIREKKILEVDEKNRRLWYLQNQWFSMITFFSTIIVFLKFVGFKVLCFYD